MKIVEQWYRLCYFDTSFREYRGNLHKHDDTEQSLLQIICVEKFQKQLSATFRIGKCSILYCVLLLHLHEDSAVCKLFTNRSFTCCVDGVVMSTFLIHHDLQHILVIDVSDTCQFHSEYYKLTQSHTSFSIYREKLYNYVRQSSNTFC